MADLKQRAIPDDNPVTRRGNDERDDRYPYGGDRNRTRGVTRVVTRASDRRSVVVRQAPAHSRKPHGAAWRRREPGDR